MNTADAFADDADADPPMTDRRAFIEAIKAAPDDDAPRLVFADWLDEYGEPERAELIRVQCELSRRNIKPCTDCEQGACIFCGKDADALRCRERELLLNHFGWIHWAGDALLTASGYTWVNHDGEWEWEFRRGFVDSLTCTGADWLTHADAILAEHPVREVTLTTDPAGSIPVAHPGVDSRGSLVFTIAGQTVAHPRPYLPMECPPGRTPEWCKALLNARWPGITFHLPEPAGGHLVPPEVARAIERIIHGDPSGSTPRGVISGRVPRPRR